MSAHREKIVVSGMPRPSRHTRRTVSREEIARRAYELFKDRGRVDGHDLDDWLQAERELRSPRRRMDKAMGQTRKGK